MKDSDEQQISSNELKTPKQSSIPVTQNTETHDLAI